MYKDFVYLDSAATRRQAEASAGREYADATFGAISLVSLLSDQNQSLRFTSQSLQRPSLIRSAGAAFLIQVAGVTASYLLHIFLARFLGADGYGGYAYAMAWATLLSTLGAFGLPLAALRFLSEYRAGGEWSLLRGAVGGFPLLTLLGAVGVSLLSTPIVILTAARPTPLLIGIAMVPLLALISVQTEMARALGRVVVSLAPSRLLRPALTLLAVYVTLYLGGHSSSDLALAATLAALFIVVVVQLCSILVILPSKARQFKSDYAFKPWLTLAVPLLVASGFSLFLAQLDVLMVGLFLSDVRVGLYSAAAKTAALVSFVLFSVNVAAAPRISALHVEGRLEDLQTLASKLAITAFWPSLVLAVALVALARPVLGLFGSDFLATTWELRVLAASYLFSAAVGSVGYFLNLTGNERHNARALVEGSIVAVTLNCILVPWIGTFGAATATALTWVFVGTRLHWLTARHVGVEASILAAFRARRAVTNRKGESG